MLAGNCSSNISHTISHTPHTITYIAVVVVAVCKRECSEEGVGEVVTVWEVAATWACGCDDVRAVCMLSSRGCGVDDAAGTVCLLCCGRVTDRGRMEERGCTLLTTWTFTVFGRLESVVVTCTLTLPRVLTTCTPLEVTEEGFE